MNKEVGWVRDGHRLRLSSQGLSTASKFVFSVPLQWQVGAFEEYMPSSVEPTLAITVARTVLWLRLGISTVRIDHDGLWQSIYLSRLPATVRP